MFLYKYIFRAFASLVILYGMRLYMVHHMNCDVTAGYILMHPLASADDMNCTGSWNGDDSGDYAPSDEDQ
jgi:hypothetical protein